MAKLKPTATYNFIYVYSIPDDDHKGLLKVGKGSLDSIHSEAQLPPMCDELKAAAKDRIDEQTKTALVKYDLEYVELAVQHLVMDDGTPHVQSFVDIDVHDVLRRSGFASKCFYDSDKKSEWFYMDLDTAKRAIAAVKAGHKVLPPKTPDPAASAKDDPDTPQPVATPSITLRDEQSRCVSETITALTKYDEMLWDCKMRFGKTVTAYEFIRRQLDKYRKTIVITHRPAVEDGWDSDHDLVFGKNSGHMFIDKTNQKDFDCDDSLDSANDAVLDDLIAQDIPFTYFASIQDLRGSKRVGGKFNKNNRVYDIHWDLVIIDEAHEGTLTELGDAVIKTLLKKGTKCLRLSGTPYNFVQAFEDNKFTWSYVDEQRAKAEWDEKHPGEKNPYATLPTMNILTFDLAKALTDSYLFETEDVAFNFTEFFRVWTGDQQRDFRKMPDDAEVGDFVHKKDVKAFLDMITTDDKNNNYPFSTPEYRDYFRHTFWLLPGVKAARALSAMLKKHAVFSHYEIVNVAGDGDEEAPYDEALKAVRTAISKKDFTITLSCGKLTTGVTVKEWTGAMMLSGSSKTAAAGYMQTIFRVQSPGLVNGRQKENVYVFDFAPDRTINVISEIHAIKGSGKGQGGGESVRIALGEFLNFCPVIAMDGTEMRYYDVPEMMRQIKRVSIDAAINSGFDDDSVFNHNAGIVFSEGDADIIKRLGDVLVPQKKGKRKKDVVINDQGLTEEQRQKAEDLGNRLKGKGKKKPLTPEEQELADKLKKQKEEQKKLFDLLRAISIRLPLLFYGADADITEAITLENFITIVDDESWAEFMPTGLKKTLFRDLLRFFDKDVVEGAGMRIRRLAKAADELPPTKRAARIVEILSRFRNPDKETVLTPWRVVNMHLGDTIGGYNFFDETYTKELDEPRLIEQGDVTAEIFLNPEAKILEMNSKSGLYPLYMAFGIYMLLVDGKESDVPFEQARAIWDKTLADHIFVLCKTKMARSITIRTLAGYTGAEVNAIYLTKLLERMEDKQRLANKLSNPKTWNKEGEKMLFDAIVGNPPYQESTGGGSADSVAATQAKPIFHLFVEQAKLMQPSYVSMIVPARWYAGGIGLNEFRDSMIHDKSISKLIDFSNSKDCFPTVDIAGGLCFFLRENEPVRNCTIVNHIGDETTIAQRDLDEFGDIFIRSNQAISIIHKIRNKTERFLDSSVFPIDCFGFPSKARGVDVKTEGAISLIHSQGTGYVNRSDVKKNAELIDKYKVTIGILVPSNGEVGIDPSKGYKSITMPKILNPGEITTFSYLVLHAFDTQKEAENFKFFMTRKLPRFMMRVTYSSMHISRANFVFVPELDYSKEWSDESLYSFFDLSDNEIAIVEKTMRSMDIE